MANNAKLVEKVYGDFAAKDMAALAEAFAEDIEWTVSAGFPYGGTFAGFDAIVANVFAKVPQDWDGFRHELHQTVTCGDDVLVSGTYYGTWKRTGRAIEAPFVHHWTLKDGIAARFHQYVDEPATRAATDGFVHGAP